MKCKNPNDTHRKCTVCKQEKLISEFGKHACMSDSVRSNCKVCGVKASMTYYEKNPHIKKMRNKKYRDKNKSRLNAMDRERRKQNPEAVRRINLRRYGISIQDYDDMYIEQGGCCAICGIHQSKIKQRLGIDHCHETGTIRGLLCNNCNTAIGLMKDSIGILDNAISYLERSIITEGANG